MSGAYYSNYPRPPLVKRKLVGGPHRGGTVEVPETMATLEIGWETGWYELGDDKRFHFVWIGDGSGRKSLPLKSIPIAYPFANGVDHGRRFGEKHSRRSGSRHGEDS